MMERVGLDFETYGGTDLPTHGLDRYASCETFRPLIGSLAFTVGPRIYKTTFDFVNDRKASTKELREQLNNRAVCAHNAPFEMRVLDELGISVPTERFIDSAVVARAAGAGSSLEAAAPQLLGVDKLETGKHLIRVFSIPGKYQEASGSRFFDPQVIEDHPFEWTEFIRYCELDAELSLRIVDRYLDVLTARELEYQAITMRMNRAGWRVDVDLVEEMLRRSQENQEQALHDFRETHGAHELNLNSLPQLKAWCLERGIKATSFDEKHVEMLHSKISKKLSEVDRGATTLKHGQYEEYCEVLSLLETKQILGGSSLKKLPVILNTVGVDGRLRDQYLHCGAGQTLRTTGRSVQMQNLKRLGKHIDPVDRLLEDLGVEWDNAMLAKNIRQAFTATHPQGRLIVGDFSSVESRGLAYLAGAGWKVRAFRAGKDMYKVLAATPEMFGVPYDQVTKEQRQMGKVGELSCGYGAGSEAVQQFAAAMGEDMSEAEAATLVRSWRAINPEVVEFWSRLDEMLHRVVEVSSYEALVLPDGMKLALSRVETPTSLLEQHPGAQSVAMTITDSAGYAIMRRFFHGCYIRGRNVTYYKPSDRKTGDLWKAHFIHPKTKQVTFYQLYGGKLAGILTQSFCRELFFMVLAQVDAWARAYPESVTLVGQFHDEIVVDWQPGGPLTLDRAKRELEQMMSDPGPIASFPLAAEIKDDYRYTK